jgi:hypothetical protein
MLNIKEQVLNTTLQIDTRTLCKTKSIDGLLVYTLKKRVEKKCSECGYIIENSVSIIDRTHGIFRSVDNKSVVQYSINYKVKTINPEKEERYKCVVNSVTKMGVISYLKLSDEDTIKESPLLVIIPKEYIDDSLFEKINEGKIIEIEILDSRMKHLSEQIQSVGKMIN